MATQDYDIHKDIKFAPLETVDVKALAASVTPWFNQALAAVNDCVVRVGVIEGEFHWHNHVNEDELFYVVEGKLIVDVEGRESTELAPGQAIVVPRRVMHRTRAPVRTVILMVEGAGVEPTGD